MAFRVRVDMAPQGLVNLSAHCVYPCQASIPFTSALTSVADGQWHDMSVPLKCLVDGGLDLTNVNTPFLLYSETPMKVALEDIRWEPWTAGKTPDCSVYTSGKDVLTAPVVPLYTDGVSTGYALSGYMSDPSQQIDLGGGNMAWIAKLVPGTNLAIHKNGFAADLSAYNTPTGALKFDLLVTAYGDPTADLLIKVATSWPKLADVRLFDEILNLRPTAGVWTSVTIPAQALIAHENHLSPGDHVDITTIADMFVIESVNGGIDAQLDNIRWEK